MSRATLQQHISTPIPTNNVTFKKHNGEDVAVIKISSTISIILFKDAIDSTLSAGHAETRVIETGGFSARYMTENGRCRLTSITYKIHVRTFYSNLDNRKKTSAYGRGTTDGDKKKGKTTLRFHEGQHGVLFIDDIRKSQFRPVTKDVKNRSYGSSDELHSILNQNYANYLGTLGRQNELKVDCVGIRPSASHIHCPAPPPPKIEPARRRRQSIE